MKLAYVVTEKQFDADILKKLLPEKLVEDSDFKVAGDRSSAAGGASTLLAVKTLPLVLVIDAHTEYDLLIREWYQDLHFLLRYGSRGAPFEIFHAVPEIEVVFFQDRSVLEELIGQKLHDLEWKFAQRHPREFLTDKLGERAVFVEKILSSLDEEMIGILQQHSLIKGIADFLTSVVYSASAV